MDFRSLGRIPKKKGPSPETVEAEAGPTETATEKPEAGAAATAGAKDSAMPSAGDPDQRAGSADGSGRAPEGRPEARGPCGRPAAGGPQGDGTALPYCPKDMATYSVCPEELHLADGQEKAVLVKGQDCHGRDLYAVALTRKYLQGGLREEDWSGHSLVHCINDILHQGAR